MREEMRPTPRAATAKKWVDGVRALVGADSVEFTGDQAFHG